MPVDRCTCSPSPRAYREARDFVDKIASKLCWFGFNFQKSRIKQVSAPFFSTYQKAFVTKRSTYLRSYLVRNLLSVTIMLREVRWSQQLERHRKKWKRAVITRPSFQPENASLILETNILDIFIAFKYWRWLFRVSFSLSSLSFHKCLPSKLKQLPLTFSVLLLNGSQMWYRNELASSGTSQARTCSFWAESEEREAVDASLIRRDNRGLVLTQFESEWAGSSSPYAPSSNFISRTI